MQPALSHLQSTTRAADLGADAERARGSGRAPRGRRGASAAEADAVRATRRAPAFGALFLHHGFFGREHGAHA